jgi:PAS domain S-box-containing protein
VTAAHPLPAPPTAWSNQWLSWFLPASGILVALLGVLVAVAWFAHWVLLIRIGPGLPAMKLNAALCFVLCGGALALVTSMRKPVAVLLAGVAACIVLTTLAEYIGGRSFGLDQFALRDYVTPGTAFPGRMSPLTASCFLFIAAGLMLSAANKVRPWHLGVAGLLACLVGVITTESLGGFLSGMEAAYGWNVYTRMAVHTAAGLLLLSVALFGWVWELSHRHQINLARWLPLTGAVTLMAVVALLAVVSLRELKNSYHARKSTYETLIAAQALLGDLTDTLRGMSGYAMTGEPEALAPYQRGSVAIPRGLATLSALTSDSAAQQGLEKPLADDLYRVLNYAQRVIALRNAGGLQAASALVATGEGRVVVDRARIDLQLLTDEVHRLVLLRDTEAEQNYRHTVALLLLACVVAALLLAFAHIAVSREVERRRRIETKLQALSAFQTAILDSANYAITSTGLDGVVTSFNATAERWLGYHAADVVGKATPALWHDPDELASHIAHMSQELGVAATPNLDVFGAYLSRGKRYESEWIFRRSDGGRFPVWLSMAALNDADGNTIGYLGIFTDITDRKGQQAALLLSEERFRRAFDDAPTGMALVQAQDGRFLKVNRALADMLGYPESELIKKNDRSITHPEDTEKGHKLIIDMLNGSVPSFQIEKRYLNRSGAVVYANLRMSLIRGEDGAPLYFVSQFENITQRHEMDRLKHDFIATVSHELRTPLTSIRGSLGLIAAGVMGVLPEKMTPMVKIALQNCERLVLIINDILDIEKIEAGKSQLQIGRVAVAALLQQALAMNQAYADKFRVVLILEAPPPELEAVADPDRLMQVITNLLSNAAKFSPPGASVRIRALPDGSNVRFEVEDDGSGIPDEFRARIFQKFAQAESSAGRHFGGTGLGLAISKSLVEQMGGRIHFESRSGGGTIFFVELPRAVGGAQAIPLIQPADTGRIRIPTLQVAALQSEATASSPRVLHVENDQDLSTVMQAALAGRANVVIAPTLAAGRRLLQEQKFAAVILDPGLPDGSGLALLDQIERITPQPPPVLVLSVTEMPPEIRRRVAAAFVKSRISEIELAETILALISDRDARAPVLI